MRGSRYLVLLAAVAVLASGCGTVVARAASVAAAASRTQARTARVTMTTAIRSMGMSMSFTETGVFDFARSVGMLRMQSPAGLASEVRFLPPRVYVKLPKLPPGTPGSLRGGKSWISVKADAPAGLAGSMFTPFGSSSPGDLLSALTAVSRSVTSQGSATIRGVPVTRYRVSIDPAKAAARVQRSRRAGFQAFAKSLGTRTIPVDVWVDQQNLVRQVRVSLHPPAGMGPPGKAPQGTGAPPGARMTLTTGFYDFGVPVRVSPPPAGEVTSMSRFSSSMSFSRDGPGSPGPPRVSGTLSPAQAAAAKAAVRRFWSALGSHDRQAAVQAVVPAEQACLRPVLDRFRFTVTSLRIVSAQPAGTGQATVRFTAAVHASIDGHRLPALPTGPGRVKWLVAAQNGGHWYVNPRRSNTFPFLPRCH